MDIVRIGGRVIGTGRPWIIVPLTSSDQSGLLAEALSLSTLPADMAEWRIDMLSGGYDCSTVLTCLEVLKKALTVPLLVTFRTVSEGGRCFMADADYENLCQELCRSRLPDLLDVEAFHTSGSAKSLIKYAHAHDIPVIASNHDFKLTPPRAEILRRLRFMQDDLGADILKIAVMPQCPADVIELFAATEEMFSRYACKPLITMSMGSLGSISRICGHVFGSAATFACSQNASAPGQMDVREVSAMLDTLGRSAPHQ